MINRITSFCRNFGSEEKPPGYLKNFNVLDEYVKEPPSNQVAADIYQGEWSSVFPAAFEVEGTGVFEAFEDSRVKWAAGELGGFLGKSILELGPLEGGHTYMAASGGASRVIAIEANKRAFVKCLIAKEITGMDNVRFLLGDFNEYLKTTSANYDITFACGVLYHMLNPAETIELISRVSNSVFIWSHYYDADLIDNNPAVKKTMGKAETVTHNGFTHTLYEHFYQDYLSVPAFCGGANPNSFWMTRQGMLDCLKYFGFEQLTINFDEPNHPGGPAMCVVGRKSEVA